MKDILLNISGSALGNNVIFNTDDINDLNAPWKLLKKKLFDLGFDIKTADQNDLSNCAWIIFIDADSLGGNNENWPSNIKSIFKKLFVKNFKPTRNLYQECIDRGLKNKTALFLWEGRSVKPKNYTERLFSKFSTIFTWDDNLVDNKKFFKFYLPSPVRAPVEPIMPFNQKKLLVNISANKDSLLPGELYSARRKTIRYFEKYYPDKFDLFGPKWDKPMNKLQKYFPLFYKKYKSYRGIAWNKIDVLSKYKFSLCYENLAKEKGYITEKIFDVMIAGCVPIYWGAENITEYVDKNAFIDRRDFKNDAELANFIINMDEKEYNDHLEAIKKYLTSDKYKLFLPDNFVDIIIKTLKL